MTQHVMLDTVTLAQIREFIEDGDTDEALEIIRLYLPDADYPKVLAHDFEIDLDNESVRDALVKRVAENCYWRVGDIVHPLDHWGSRPYYHNKRFYCTIYVADGVTPDAQIHLQERSNFSDEVLPDWDNPLFKVHYDDNEHEIETPITQWDDAGGEYQSCITAWEDYVTACVLNSKESVYYGFEFTDPLNILPLTEQHHGLSRKECILLYLRTVYYDLIKPSTANNSP